MIQYKTKLSSTLPKIKNVDELADLLTVNAKLLYLISNNISSWYKCFQIPKRNGSMRNIEAPFPYLKKIQKRINEHILSPFALHDRASAFIPGKNIRYNASFHVNKSTILNCDIQNFFPSLKSFAVFNFFKAATNYPADVIMILTKLCTLDNHLPQGAPTSPVLSNLLMYQIDTNLFSWAKEHNLSYSRYADDLTFSGNIDNVIQKTILKKVKQNLATLHLKLNAQKTKCYNNNHRQLVTGLVVNQKVGIPREDIRKLRTYIHYIKLDITKGTFKYNHQEFEHNLGLLNYYCSINILNENLFQWRKLMLDVQKKYKNI